jgi:3,4-dihydroxy-2-butanone 4-phosphate synthase
VGEVGAELSAILISSPIRSTQQYVFGAGAIPHRERNESRFGTPFTVSIEARDGVSTGVSAADRLATVRAAIAPNAKPEDLVRPGHVFPLCATTGGVLTRRGLFGRPCGIRTCDQRIKSPLL